MGILGDWSDYNAINDDWTFMGKKKMLCLWFSNPYKGTQTITIMLFSRILWDEFYNEKNKETYVNQFLCFKKKKPVLPHLRFLTGPFPAQQ